MLRLVTIDNISGRAFTLVPPGFDTKVLLHNPRDTYRLCAGEECDAALLPVACYPELDDRYQLLGRYGIACRGQVNSVRLFSTVPLRSLVIEQHPIYVDAESRTSRELLRVLCLMKFGLAGHVVDGREGVSAQLLIGDKAIVESQRRSEWKEIVDLGAWWNEQTQLPFVYARWVVRRTVPELAKTRILHWLEATTLESESSRGMSKLVQSGLGEMTSDRFARNYYGRIHARLESDDIAGIRAFWALQENKTLCPQID